MATTTLQGKTTISGPAPVWAAGNTSEVLEGAGESGGSYTADVTWTIPASNNMNTIVATSSPLVNGTVIDSIVITQNGTPVPSGTEFAPGDEASVEISYTVTAPEPSAGESQITMAKVTIDETQGSAV